MQTDWLIDFMTLAQTRSFSRSAQLRHITQPAFSRRIRALEAWASTELVDRTCHPPGLTQAGRVLYVQAPSIVSGVQHTHSLLRAHTAIGQDVLRFAALHTLALNFFPTWIGGLGTMMDGLTTRLTALDPSEGMQKLHDGHCDLLLVYSSRDLPLDIDHGHCELLTLGQERLVPCARPDASGRMQHMLPGLAQRPLPYLAHSAGTGLGQAVELALKRKEQGLHLQRVFESDACETLRAMALAGHGIAFLPERSVLADLAGGRLASAGEVLDVVLDICLLRMKPAHTSTHLSPLDNLWTRLKTSPGNTGPGSGSRARGTHAQAVHRELTESL